MSQSALRLLPSQAKDSQNGSPALKSFVHLTKKNSREDLDLVQLQNFAFNKMRINNARSMQTTSPHSPHRHTKSNSPNNSLDSAERNYGISSFPIDSTLPLDLYPFDKKVRMAQLAQRRNEKHSHHSEKLRKEFIIRFQKNLRHRLNMKHDVIPTLKNEKQVKLWHLLMSKNQKKSKHTIVAGKQS